jgi:two-component system chemotaxis response regulator CheY
MKDGHMPMTRILTVDDSRSMRALVRMTLKGDGFDVVEAEDGQAALDWLESNEVDLIITDINMPRLDGFGFIEKLRSEQRCHVGRPILVLSTENTDDKRTRARDAGATGWIVKPFDPELLVAAVRHVMH